MSGSADVLNKDRGTTSVFVLLLQLIASIIVCELVYRVSVKYYARRFPPKPAKRPAPVGTIPPHPVLYLVRMMLAAGWYGLGALMWSWFGPTAHPLRLPFSWFIGGGGAVGNNMVSVPALFIFGSFVLVFNFWDPLFNPPPVPPRPPAWYDALSCFILDDFSIS